MNQSMNFIFLYLIQFESYLACLIYDHLFMAMSIFKTFSHKNLKRLDRIRQ